MPSRPVPPGTPCECCKKAKPDVREHYYRLLAPDGTLTEPKAIFCQECFAAVFAPEGEADEEPNRLEAD